MTEPVWTTLETFLGTFTQRQSVLIPFTATGTSTNFSIIAGSLPEGLMLQVESTATTATTTGFIFGSSNAVPTDLTSKFVIRAANSTGITDKTFTIDITGATEPVWITPSGYLPVGSSNEYFAINRQIVDYQLAAQPNTLFDNMEMRYYIEDGEGVLPSGLRLTEDGRITGTIKEVTIQNFDSLGGVGYDGLKYDSYGYDTVEIIDLQPIKPKFIPKQYQFYVTASDGYNTSKRLFKMKIVDANSLRSDTTWIYADADYFLSSDSYLFSPNWLNPANLGIRRASNYQIIPIKLYDPVPGAGPLLFEWDNITVNPEIKARANSSSDPNTYRQTTNLAGDTVLYLKNLTALPVVGQKFRLDSYVEGAGTTTYTITSVSGDLNNCSLQFKRSSALEIDLLDDIPNDTILFLGSSSEHPIGFQLDTNSGNLYGQIPYIPAYSIDYKFTIRMIRTSSTGEVRKYDRVFSLRLQGSVDSDLRWITTSTVGEIKTGYQSELSVVAAHYNHPEIGVTYRITAGELPTGLEFKSDGTIIGKIPFDKTTTVDGITDDLDFTIDGGNTDIDRTYTFTVEATDIYRLAAIDKEFTIKLGDNSLTPYSSIYMRPFMYRDKRKSYRNFINDSSVFDYKVLYRPNDPAFGLQSEIKLVLEHGIERLNLAEYIIGLQNYFYNKRFFFGEVKTLKAEDETGKYVYDLVYVDVIDYNSVANRSPDTVSFFINDSIASYSIASIENWQRSLEAIPIKGETIKVDEFLRPRFMRTIQQDTGAPLGFIKAMPICYTLPGEGATVVRKIKLSGFDFRVLDFEVDRLVIDNTLDYSGDKYLKFPVTNIDSQRPLDVIAGPDGIILESEDGQDLFTDI